MDNQMIYAEILKLESMLKSFPVGHKRWEFLDKVYYKEIKRIGESITIENKKITDLAELLHDTYCHSSHIDQCGWGYEQNDWGGHTHYQYLKGACDIIAFLQMK